MIHCEGSFASIRISQHVLESRVIWNSSCCCVSVCVCVCVCDAVVVQYCSVKFILHMGIIETIPWPVYFTAHTYSSASILAYTHIGAER
jgi:hypothetical protein